MDGLRYVVELRWTLMAGDTPINSEEQICELPPGDSLTLQTRTIELPPFLTPVEREWA